GVPGKCCCLEMMLLFSHEENITQHQKVTHWAFMTAGEQTGLGSHHTGTSRRWHSQVAPRLVAPITTTTTTTRTAATRLPATGCTLGSPQITTRIFEDTFFFFC
ncbi:unnamed protein product, partial [Notodromas monacha]